MNTYRKLSDGTWTIATPASADVQSGSTITVTLRNGSTKQVTVAHIIRVEQGYSGTVRLFAIAEEPRPAPVQVGNLDGIIALFNQASRNLRRPAIVLAAGGHNIRLSVAGSRARFPGTVNVTTQERNGEGQRGWFGRINRGGAFEPGRNPAVAAIIPTLQRFAADPATVAAEHGRLNGACCFCNRTLTDERSLAVGYGPDCAENYGLPWGARAPAVVDNGPRIADAIERIGVAARPTPAAAPADAGIFAAYAEAVAQGRLVDQPVTLAEMRQRLEAINS